MEKNVKEQEQEEEEEEGGVGVRNHNVWFFLLCILHTSPLPTLLSISPYIALSLSTTTVSSPTNTHLGTSAEC
jgi:hypothetical protein